MNVTINIYGDVHIHCDCCDERGVYNDDLEKSPEAPYEDAPDTEDEASLEDPTQKSLRNMNLPSLISVKTGRRRPQSICCKASTKATAQSLCKTAITLCHFPVLAGA